MSCRTPSACDICGRDTPVVDILQFQRRPAPPSALAVILRRGLLRALTHSLPRLPVACTSFRRARGRLPALAPKTALAYFDSPRATRKESTFTTPRFPSIATRCPAPPHARSYHRYVHSPCAARLHHVQPASRSCRPFTARSPIRVGGRGPACLLGATLLAFPFPATTVAALSQHPG